VIDGEPLRRVAVARSGMRAMNDPFVIASIALGLSVAASAVRMVDWFLHADPRVAAQVTRWGVRGIAALSVPLLLVLLFKEQWTAATALGAAMVLVPAVLGRRLWRWIGVPSFAGYGAPAGAGPHHAAGQPFTDEAELVRYSAAVLDAYLRRTAAAPAAVGSDVPAIVDRTGENGSANSKGQARRKANGKGSEANGIGDVSSKGDTSGNGHAETFGLGAMSEEEACAVLGVDRGVDEAEIRAAHSRISAVVDPAQGGSPYLAIKVDQAKEVLVRAAGERSAQAPPKAPRRRGATRRHPSPPA
jgi:hypothetical protein